MRPMARRGSLRDRLLAVALGLPGAREDHPWGETVVKVQKKVFLFAGAGDGSVPERVSVKLPESADEALAFPGSAPTSHGLGRAGWVTVPLAGVPAGLLEDWVEESYRAVAPKKLVEQLDRASGRTEGLAGPG